MVERLIYNMVLVYVSYLSTAYDKFFVPLFFYGHISPYNIMS